MKKMTKKIHRCDASCFHATDKAKKSDTDKEED